MSWRDWALAPGPLVDEPPAAGIPPEGGEGGEGGPDDCGKGPPAGTGPVAGCGVHWNEPCGCSAGSGPRMVVRAWSKSPQEPKTASSPTGPGSWLKMLAQFGLAALLGPETPIEL